MCINCGFIGQAPGRPSDVGMMCSLDCEAQWNALCDTLLLNTEPDSEEDQALYELGKFATKWPDATLDEFKHLVATSQRMAALYPTVWPFLIEYHEGKGCWHYARKGAGMMCH
jgi:hypothetical protein